MELEVTSYFLQCSLIHIFTEIYLLTSLLQHPNVVARAVYTPTSLHSLPSIRLYLSFCSVLALCARLGETEYFSGFCGDVLPLPPARPPGGRNFPLPPAAFPPSLREPPAASPLAGPTVGKRSV